MKQYGFDFSEKKENSQEEGPRVLTVSEINSGIRRILEANYPLIWVQGELSNFTAHSSGHFYFSLKDKKSQVSAVMFRGFNQKLKFRPETGMEVLVRGKITVYEPRGNYQLFCELMEPVGLGAMQKAFEQLKEKLKREGLFDASRKKSLPTFPKHIAVVTSPTGAAIRDVINVLKRRNRTAKVTVIPTLVQGDGAPDSIVSSIKKAQLLKDVDVMIVGRGGGSMEDLWGFNSEKVARTIAECPIPIVSAVGHEVDFTISDFVADLRAPTPSAAAELVVKNVDDLVEKSNEYLRRLIHAMEVLFAKKKKAVEFYSGRLVDPKREIEQKIQRCDELLVRLDQSMQRVIKSERARTTLLLSRLGDPKGLMDRYEEKLAGIYQQLVRQVKVMLGQKESQLQRSFAVLDSLSPLRVVERGYSITRKEGVVVKSVGQVEVEDLIEVKVSDGVIAARVEGTELG